MLKYILSPALCLGLALACSGSVFALGDDDKTLPKPKPPKACKKGQIWSERDKKCMPKKAGLAPDHQLIARGWQLAYAGHYGEAIEVFELVRDKDRPRLLNGLGYSHRKLGRLDQAIAYYHAAIALQPNYVLAREYLGEGYVAQGHMQLAKAQLDEIAKRCGGKCLAWRKLAGVIAASETAANQ